jgi:hypothetical protein
MTRLVHGERGETVRATRSPARCPYCRDDLVDTKALVACAACGARHHDVCHEQHGACAGCGSAEALYARAARRPNLRPPAGSRIRVSSHGERTTIGWRTGNAQDWLLVLLMMIVPPLGIYVLVRLLTEDWQELHLTPDAITFTSNLWGGLAHGRRTIPRSEVGTVRVVGQQGTFLLAIDHGVKRHHLYTSSLTPALSPPELEWLAARIEAWKRA